MKFILQNYLSAYLAIYALIVVFAWIVLSRPKLGIVFTRNGYRFMLLSVIPVIFYHLLFLNLSLQRFTALYGAVFLCVLAGIFYDKLRASKAIPLRQLNFGVIGLLAFMTFQYWIINLPGEFSIEGVFYKEQLVKGEMIRKEAPKDAVLFFKGYKPQPGDIFYAKRNVLYIEENQDAIEFLARNHLAEGLIFEFNQDFKLIRKTPVNQ